jgi:hypothetical protein
MRSRERDIRSALKWNQIRDAENEGEKKKTWHTVTTISRYGMFGIDIMIQWLILCRFSPIDSFDGSSEKAAESLSIDVRLSGIDWFSSGGFRI